MKTLTIKRPFNPRKPVRVYRNLHKDVWSIMQGGLVVAHATRMYLKDAKFQVRPAGRDKVRKEGKKNVHAFIVGTLCDVAEIRLAEQKYLDGPDDVLPYFGVTYNPYTDDTFINESHDEAIHEAQWVDLDMEATMKVMAIFTPEEAEKQWPPHSVGL